MIDYSDLLDALQNNFSVADCYVEASSNLFKRARLSRVYAHTRLYLTFELRSYIPSTEIQKMFRLLDERRRGIFGIIKTGIATIAPGPGISAMSIHTGWYTGKESKKFRPSGYVSAARGESVCDFIISFLFYNDCQSQLI